MNYSLFFPLFCVFGEVCASSEVSLNLTGYVDPEVNIERIDDKGDALDIFSREESRYRITSNIDKGVSINFRTQHDWQLKHETQPDKFIPYKGVFKGVSKTVEVNNETDSVIVDQKDFTNGEYEFGMIFKSKSRMKELIAGKYSGCVTISVSTEG